MQSRSIDELSMFNEMCAKNLRERTDNIASTNAEAIKGKLPEGVEAPNPEQVAEMGEWVIAYRKKNPRASEREVRRALKTHFKIVEIK